MKAKDYVEMYKRRLEETNDPYKSFSDMFIEFVHESGEVAKQRGVKTDSALLGVIREFDAKWRAISRMMNFNSEGFLFWVKNNIPDVYKALLQEHDRQIRR